MLAVIILLIALPCFNLYLHESGLYGHSRIVYWIVEIFPFVVVMPFGPLIYFYTKSVIDPTFRLTGKQRNHFAPVVIDLIPHVIVWVFMIGLFLGIFNKESGPGWGNVIDEINAYSDIPRWISITLYVWFAGKYLRDKLKVNAGLAEQSDYKWLKLFLNVFLTFQTLWLFFLVPYIIPQIRYSLLDTVGWSPVYVPLVIIIYWLGLKGYFQTLSKNSVKNGTSISISIETVEKTTALLVRSMNENKRYLDPALSLTSLSKDINLPQKTISAVLNQHLHKSFSDFVNEYRVAEVKKRLLNPRNTHLTITGIAFECGFNSQATFQRAFKQLTHLSPSEFLAGQAASMGNSEKITV